eukprot:gene4794-8380_t
MEKNIPKRIIHTYYNEDEEDTEDPQKVSVEQFEFINPKKVKRENFLQPNINEIEGKKRLQKQLKQYIIFNKLRKLKKSDRYKGLRQRMFLVKELVQTEKTYVSNLKLFINTFINPLKKILNSNQMTSLFSNIEQIYQLNVKLLIELEKTMEQFPKENRIGEICSKVFPFFRSYTVYINNYDTALESKEKYLKSIPSFFEFIENERLKYNSLGFYLIMPVQRIPRYKLFFEDILKNTPPNYIDLKSTEDGLKKISEIALFVNDGKKISEISKILKELSKLIGEKYLNELNNRKFKLQGSFELTFPKQEIHDEIYEGYCFQNMLILIGSNNNLSINNLSSNGNGSSISSGISGIGNSISNSSSNNKSRTSGQNQSSKKKEKRNVLFIYFSCTKLIQCQNTTEIKLETLNEGENRMIYLKFKETMDRELWENLFLENIEIERIALLNSGIKQEDLIKFGVERNINYQRIEPTLFDLNEMSLEFDIEKKNLFTVDVELKHQKLKLEELQQKIKMEEEKKYNLEKNLYNLTLNQRKLVIDLKENLNDLESKQNLFNEILNSDISLNQVLGSSWDKLPKNKKEKEDLIPVIKEFIPKIIQSKVTKKPLPLPSKPLPNPNLNSLSTGLTSSNNINNHNGKSMGNHLSPNNQPIVRKHSLILKSNSKTLPELPQKKNENCFGCIYCNGDWCDDNPCANCFNEGMEHLCDRDCDSCLEGCGSIFSGFICCCCMTPIAISLFFFLVSIPINLVLFCPPLTVLLSALPCLRSDRYDVYEYFESKQNRADPSEQGHVHFWHEKGYVRAFLICCLLTLFGFLPGVIFACIIAINHFIRYMNY